MWTGSDESLPVIITPAVVYGHAQRVLDPLHNSKPAAEV
jgi:hypothetical protein